MSVDFADIVTGVLETAEKHGIDTLIDRTLSALIKHSGPEDIKSRVDRLSAIVASADAAADIKFGPVSP